MKLKAYTYMYHSDGQLARANYGGKSEEFLWDGLALVRRNDEHFINEPHVGNAPKKLRFEGKPRAQRSARRARKGPRGNPVASSKGTSYFNDMLGTTVGFKSNGKYSAAALSAFGENLPVHSPTPTQNSNYFKWNYLFGSDLKSSLVYPNGLTASWTYDVNNQLLQVCNAFPTNVISQYDYTYDAIGCRIKIARSGSAMSETRTDVYGYNVRNELISAAKLVGRDDPIAPQSPTSTTEYAYQYDDIGNRLTSLDLGTNRTYTANNLNQYTSISNSVASALSAGEFIPQFDDDGNQTLIKTATGIWQIQYNGENRPIFWENVSTNFLTPNSLTPTLISMSYDRMGRRVLYLETCGSTTNANNTFTYDNYLLVASNRNNFDSTFSTDSFVWDPTEPIATRPLLFCFSNAPPQYYTHDGNKNVSDLTDSTQKFSAHYEYAPFGANRLCYKSSSKSPWRFSSEFFDDVTELACFNYRNYHPDIGVWIERDRINYHSGAFQYNFCLNNPYLYFDNKGDHPLILILIPLILFNPNVAIAPGVDDPEITSMGSAGMIVDLVGGKLLAIPLKCCSVKSSGEFISEPTPTLKILADRLGGVGTVTKCGNTVGCCAEFHAADDLIAGGSVLSDIRFTKAIRPRLKTSIPACENCLKLFSDNLTNRPIPVKTPEYIFVPISQFEDNE